MAETIDWSAPLEAYHPDGRVVEVKLEEGVTGPDHDGEWEIHGFEIEEHFFDPDGTGVVWRIRNCKPAPQYPPELVERMVEVVTEGTTGRVDGNKCRSILADLPQPVDADLALAREIASTVVRNEFADLALRGGMDNDGSVMAALAAIKLVRAEKG